MGNRAIVIFSDKYQISPAIYLHWNGGPESVYAFLAETNRRCKREADYRAARFVAVVAEFFDQDAYSGASLGIYNGPPSTLPSDLAAIDPGDNGVYVFDDIGGIGRYMDGRTLTQKEIAAEKRKAETSDKYLGILAIYTKKTEKAA